MRNARFDLQARIIWLPRPDPEVEAELDAQHERIPGTLKWKMREPSIVQRAASFVGAVASGLVADEVVKMRLESCMSCTALVRGEDGSYCGACGCGRWKLAQLDGVVLPKLRWAKLDCPLKRLGFSNS